MSKITKYFYKYEVNHCEVIDDKHQMVTTTGITFGKTFNEACAKVTDYFGEDSIDDIKLEFIDSCDVLELSELQELFLED